MTDSLPGYDAWKLACPYDMTAEQEAAARASRSGRRRWSGGRRRMLRVKRRLR
jgi:hypothetical protein